MFWIWFLEHALYLITHHNPGVIMPCHHIGGC